MFQVGKTYKLRDGMDTGISESSIPSDRLFVVDYVSYDEFSGRGHFKSDAVPHEKWTLSWTWVEEALVEAVVKSSKKPKSDIRFIRG